jgi:hypothetical protein
MPETSAFLSERLRAEGEKIVAFFAGLKPDQWQTPVYSEGENWTVRSVLSHFVTSEKGFVKIFGSIRDGGPGVSEDFDIDRYNSSQQKKTSELSPSELIESYQAVRAQMVELVASFSETDLTRQGRHPFLGETTLTEMIKMVYRHNQIHYRDLRKVIGEM